MSFHPNRNGPFCPMGEIEVAASGTAIPMDTHWTPDYSPQTPTVAFPGNQIQENTIRLIDIIISSPPDNSGGLYVVTYDRQNGIGSKDVAEGATIVLYIPQGSGPVSLRQVTGQSKFSPFFLAIDADQNGDKAWVTGVIG